MEKTATFDLPYFDVCFSQTGAARAKLESLIGEHVHWGYWENPNTADGTVADFHRAADALVGEIFRHSGLSSQKTLLDVGCGFGGTVRWAAKHFEPIGVTGLNIDSRQIQRARELTQKFHTRSQIDFIVGDACELPFEDTSFDVVSAVECIFHFPSRDRFFAEARRVLKPGGRIVMSDFILNPLRVPWILPVLPFYIGSLKRIYGAQNQTASFGTYRSLAAKHGFNIMTLRDITKETLPTYRILLDHADLTGDLHRDFYRGNRFLQQISKLRAQKYAILAFEKR